MTNRGFSLLELLIVVIIIGIITAMAIPSLLASRRASNEASAIASVRKIHSAQSTYYSAYGQNSNFATLSALGLSGLLDDQLGNADTTTKSGYSFTVSLPVAAPYGIYCATGSANAFGQTGARDFLVSNAGVVHATPTDGSMSCNNGLPNTAGGSPIQ